jgi:glycosyltransferase involved in cell wall biosynthesis
VCYQKCRRPKLSENRCDIVEDGSKSVNGGLIKNEFDFQDLPVLRNMRKPGASGARNTGFLECEVEFVAFLDDDDG